MSEASQDPNLHYVKFKWEDPSPSSIIVTGTFDNWSSSGHLTKLDNGRGFEGEIGMPYGQKVLFKYIVDGTWLVREDEPKVWDDNGNENHFVVVPPAPQPDQSNPTPTPTQSITTTTTPAAAATVPVTTTKPEYNTTETEVNALRNVEKPVEVQNLVKDQPIIPKDDLKIKEAALNSEQSQVQSQPEPSATQKVTAAATQIVNQAKSAVTEVTNKVEEKVAEKKSNSENNPVSRSISTTPLPEVPSKSYQTPAVPPKEPVAASKPVESTVLPSTPIKTAAVNRVPLVPYAPSPFTPAPAVSNATTTSGADASTTTAVKPVDEPAIVKDAQIQELAPSVVSDANASKTTTAANENSQSFPTTESPSSHKNSFKGFLSNLATLRPTSEGHNSNVSAKSSGSTNTDQSEHGLRKRKSSMLAKVKSFLSSPGKSKGAAAGITVLVAVFSLWWNLTTRSSI